MGADIVLRHAVAVEVHRPEIVLGGGVTLVRSEATLATKPIDQPIDLAA